MTQAWLGTDVSAGDGLMYEAVHCLACSQQHFVCVATGHVLGDSGAATPTLRSPAFPPRLIEQDYDRAFERRPTAHDGAGAMTASNGLPDYQASSS